MNENEKILYKYLDIIIIESSLVEENNSRNILHLKYLDDTINSDEFFRITLGVVKLGCELGFLRYKYNQYEGFFDLTAKGISAKEKGGYFKYLEFIEKKELEKVKPTIIADNYIGGDNHGIQSSRSELKKIKTIQKIHPQPKEIKQNPIISFLSKCWWQILIPLTIVIIGILIEKGIINIGI